MNRADLHMHSTISDGTDDVLNLVEKIARRGIKTFSITDHDNYMYADEIRKKSEENGMHYINGIEFSCRTKKLCHILGYGFDIENTEIKSLTEKKLQMQKNKMNARIKRLNEQFGIAFSVEDIEWLNSNNRAGKPHLAQLIVKNGYAENREKAFSDYLLKIHVKSENLTPDEAIKAIHKANGIAIWAHPLGGEGETHLTPERFYQEFEILSQSGIDGLECFYSRYNESEIKFLTNFAKEHNLLISGGSDYHGTNKDIALGELNNFGRETDESLLTVLNRI